MRRSLVLGLVSAAALVAAPSAAQTPALCTGTLSAAGVPRQPGPALRFGISPLVQAGQVGPLPQPAKPDDPLADMRALQELRPPGGPFVLRLTRLFWSGGEPLISEYLGLVHAYTAAGLQVELQLRFQPPAGHAGDIAGWTAWVREVVQRFGADRGVVGMQVTNEVNFTASPDSSDGASTGARDALIAGVIAAKAQARAVGRPDLRIGFNYFYRGDPADDASFWSYLGTHGGAAFAAAVDWVGLDVYPGTFFPPAEPDVQGYADGVVNALSALRGCDMPAAGLGASVPIQIEENGYPTGPGRSEATQLDALRAMIGAVQDFRGTYNVSDYRWFNLRDADSSSPNFQQNFGLLHDDDTPKPAFAAYRQLVAALSIRSGPAAVSTGGPARAPARGPVLTLRRCRAVVRGPGVTRVIFRELGRRLAVRRRAPFAVRVVGPGTVLARVHRRGRPWVVLRRRVRGCRIRR